MRVLVVCDDKWHPAATPRVGLQPLAGAEFALDWLEDGGRWSPSLLEGMDVVLLTKSNNRTPADAQPWMTAAVEAELVDFVMQGGGLLVVHSGTVGYGESPTLRGLMGGVFAQHPPQCDVTVAPLTNHPIAAGVAPFTARDEHYFMTLEPDQSAFEHFLSTTSEHGQQPGGWAHRTQRVCVLTPGHNVDVWLQPGFQHLLTNSLRWCTASAAV